MRRHDDRPFFNPLGCPLSAAIARSSPLPLPLPGLKPGSANSNSKASARNPNIFFSALAAGTESELYPRMAIVPPIRTFFSLTRRRV